MITILYPFRDKELSRIKNSLDSLCLQTNQNFSVLFIDYGSPSSCSLAVQNVLRNYTFVRYQYSYNEHQPWSRARALNIGLKLVRTPYVFAADIDMIFREDFVAILHTLTNPKYSYFFKVGFLSAKTTNFEVGFDSLPVVHSSGTGAQGLSLFPIKALLEINGFDEFYHFWGAEDEDVHNRLRLAGFEISFYDKEILLLHQWHDTYRNSEKRILTQDLQCAGIVAINQQHLLENKRLQCTIAQKSFGKIITKLEYERLNASCETTILNNQKAVIDHFLFYTLSNLPAGKHHFSFIKDTFSVSVKYFVKKALGKKVPIYYSLKAINDFLLLHLITSNKKFLYQFCVAATLDVIDLKIYIPKEGN